MDGHNIEPSVSVPSDTAAIFAATDIADPLLDPHGSADATYGFYMTSSKFQYCNLKKANIYISILLTLWTRQNSVSTRAVYEGVQKKIRA